MAEFYKGDIPIVDIEEGLESDASHPTEFGRGLVPRDYEQYPESMMASPSEMVTVDPSEWDPRYDERERTKSSLEHIYLSGPNGTPRFVNLDQGRDGDCWAYSTGHAIMLERLKANLPVVRLNPHGVAAMLKRPDVGGWCGLSGRFGAEHGYPVEGTGPGEWPKQSHDLRYDTPECRERMKMFRVTEDWYDLLKPGWGQRMTTRQLATCGFHNVPAPSDFNWWRHSVCQVRWVRIERGSWGPLILNSWKGWGRFGLAVLRGKQAIADGAIAIRSSVSSIGRAVA